MKRSNFLKSLVALPTLGGLANLATWETDDNSIGNCYLTYDGVKISGTDKKLYSENIVKKEDSFYIVVSYKQIECGMVDGIVSTTEYGTLKSSHHPIQTNGSELEIKHHYMNANMIDFLR